MRGIIASFLALCLLTSQASAWFLINSYILGPPPTVTMTRGTCVADNSDTTTYSASFTNVGTGASDSDSVTVVVGVLAMDSLDDFTVSSMTIDGVSADKRVDATGTTRILRSAFFTAPAAVTNAANVAISVTFSEAITGAVVCAWALKNLISPVPLAVGSDDGGSGQALTLDVSASSSNGFVLGVCNNSTSLQTTTWTTLTERQDANSDFDYSNADAAGTGSSMTISCDWTGATEVSGATISLGN